MNTIPTNHKAKTIQEAVLLHLIDRRGEWVKSYELVQKWFYGKFTGISADRQARALAQEGFGMFKGTKFFVERRQKGKYAEFRCTGGKKEIIRYEMVEKDGQVVARPIQETLAV